MRKNRMNVVRNARHLKTRVRARREKKAVVKARLEEHSRKDEREAD